MSQRVDGLKADATNERLPQADRDAALSSLRTMAQGGASGAECRAAREALAQLGARQEHPPKQTEADKLIDDLLAASGKQTLGDVEYSAIHAFCSERRWNADSKELYDAWAANNMDALETVLKTWLGMHHESRMTAKHMLQNLGKSWPHHWVTREALEKFVADKPACDDARTVVSEYLAHGSLDHLERPPHSCQCRKLEDAINRAYAAKDPSILIHFLNEESLHAEAE